MKSVMQSETVLSPLRWRCGKCRRYMKFIQAKPSRLYCSACDETFSLPQNGNIKLYKELKCPLDEFELLLWTTGARGKVSFHVKVTQLFNIYAHLYQWFSVRMCECKLFHFTLSTFLLFNIYSVSTLCWTYFILYLRMFGCKLFHLTLSTFLLCVEHIIFCIYFLLNI